MADYTSYRPKGGGHSSLGGDAAEVNRAMENAAHERHQMALENHERRDDGGPIPSYDPWVPEKALQEILEDRFGGAQNVSQVLEHLANKGVIQRESESW
jgi:hypothetical protein